MKSLADYIAELSSNNKEVDMKPLQIMAEQNNGDIKPWNTTRDRWSRKAKHQMSIQQKEDIENSWETGDMALYEGQTVEIVIPRGPNSTVGIVLEGKTKMVGEGKLSRIDEGVLGGMQQLAPINRIMQLAGLNTPAIAEPIAETPNINGVENLEEAGSTNVVEQLFNNNKARFKNPAAARLETIGMVLEALGDQISSLPNDLSPNDSDMLQSSGTSGKMDMIVGLPALGITLRQAASKLEQVKGE